MRVRTLGALAVGILLTAVTAAQTPPPQVPAAPQGGAMPGPPLPQTPARDNPTAATGTGRIRGRVVSADNGTPLRRAQVRLNAIEMRVSHTATTDAEGRYEFSELPAGRYTMLVSRNGYVTLQFGQQRAFEPGRPLELGAAQVMERIDFALPRGSVIAGRVTDELGEPMAGVRIDCVTLSVFAERRTAAQSVQSRRHVQHRHERSRRVQDFRPDAGHISGECRSRSRRFHQHTRWPPPARTFVGRQRRVRNHVLSRNVERR